MLLWKSETRSNEGKVIIVILLDTGECYLSTCKLPLGVFFAIILSAVKSNMPM